MSLQARNWLGRHDRGRDRRSAAGGYVYVQRGRGDPRAASRGAPAQRSQLHVARPVDPGREPWRLLRQRQPASPWTTIGRDLAQLPNPAAPHWPSMDFGRRPITSMMDGHRQQRLHGQHAGHISRRLKISQNSRPQPALPRPSLDARAAAWSRLPPSRGPTIFTVRRTGLTAPGRVRRMSLA